MIEIIYTDSYIKRARKFIKKHPELLFQYKKTLELLEINPNHPSLQLQKLKGKLSGFYDFIIEDDKIILIDVGSHDEIY